MLKLITEELDQEGMVYSYLDGSTRDRKQAVQTFQEDNQCRIMVISLKAGGLGLNLTEADYIYLIDPWWNPAVEQQAIDRTHRIGQDKHIFAYKMICKDTVEEKILNLQERKKNLAEDLITAEQSFIKKLTEEDIRAIFD
jgi:non-specific serine/threonine protein kinase